MQTAAAAQLLQGIGSTRQGAESRAGQFRRASVACALRRVDGHCPHYTARTGGHARPQTQTLRQSLLMPHTWGVPLQLTERSLPRGAARASASGAAWEPRHVAQVERAVEEWLRLDDDPDTRAEVEQLVADAEWTELQERMCARLEFGTAGLRGVMGAGFSRMNHVTVLQATQGLWAHLQAQDPRAPDRGLAIAYDARHNSKRYAELAAAAVVARGGRVHLFREPVPTPLLAYTVTHQDCAAGIMVTASHNPKEYNGYKVYWSNGCQIIPPLDSGIAAAIEDNLELWDRPAEAELEGHPLVSDPAPESVPAYFAQLVGALQLNPPEVNAGAPPLVYTPLHGVGLPSVRRAFAAFGLPEPLMVESQMHPDPEFPTVAFPNPEEGRATWKLALAAADAADCRLALANDPDADRLAAAERVMAEEEPAGGGLRSSAGGWWRPFSGNEIGVLLADWAWTNFKRNNPDVPPEKVAMLASTVSSKMIGAMAAAEGFRFEETLTGFKWLGNVARGLEAEGYRVVFAFEEAIGFMFADVLHDKDGVAAAAAFAEMHASLANRGVTVSEHLAALGAKYGFHESRQHYFVAPTPAVSQAVFTRLRSGPGGFPKQCGPFPITHVMDLGLGIDTKQADCRPVLPWTQGDSHMQFTVEGGATFTLRASGTEPKLKYYLEVKGDEQEEVRERAKALEAAIIDDLVQADQCGLTRGPMP